MQESFALQILNEWDVYHFSSCILNGESFYDQCQLVGTVCHVMHHRLAIGINIQKNLLQSFVIQLIYGDLASSDHICNFPVHICERSPNLYPF